MIFSVGFEYKDVRYGFSKKKLYRLPYEKDGRHYGLMVMPQINVGNKKGYRIQRDKLSINRIKNITIAVSWEVEQVFKHKDCPF